jgi:Xaa-Pro aminopeptidase
MTRIPRLFLTGVALVGLVTPLAAQIPSSEYAARRAALAERVETGVVVAFGGREPVRHWPPFFQLPAFRYLTGFVQSNAALVMVSNEGKTTETLFVARPDARTALYDGKRLDLADVTDALDLPARYSDGMTAYVDSLVEQGLPVYSVADYQANEFSARDSLSAGRMFVRGLRERHPGLVTREVNDWVDQLRAKKSEAEIELLTKAAEVSSRAHEAAMRAIRPGMRENEIQAVMESTYRSLGADAPGYASIVGSGPNSTVLHYPAGTREVQAGEVVLMDVAAYYEGYSADITRTVPVDRTFSAEIRDVYTVVLDAQKAAETAILPGVARDEPTRAAYEVLWQGLVDLGLIESTEASFDPPPGLCPGAWANDDGSCPQWYLYIYHGFIHGIGLDVHDPSQYANVPPFTFEPGDVFTIEPGIYVRQDIFEGLPDTRRNREMIDRIGDAAQRYRNIGVRIEDNYVLTPAGLVRITDVPREIEDIEKLRERVIS